MRLRKLRNISQETLALEAKVDRRYMSDIENGKRNVSLDVISRLANYFGVSISFLMGEAERSELTFANIEDVRKFLIDREEEDTIIFTNPDYVDAIIGHDNNGHLIYSYTKMAESLMVNDNMNYEEAVEFIDYNTIRALPYMGDKAPIIAFDLY